MSATELSAELLAKRWPSQSAAESYLRKKKTSANKLNCTLGMAEDNGVRLYPKEVKEPSPEALAASHEDVVTEMDREAEYDKAAEDHVGEEAETPTEGVEAAAETVVQDTEGAEEAVIPAPEEAAIPGAENTEAATANNGPTEGEQPAEPMPLDPGQQSPSASAGEPGEAMAQEAEAPAADGQVPPTDELPDSMEGLMKVAATFVLIGDRARSRFHDTEKLALAMALRTDGVSREELRNLTDDSAGLDWTGRLTRTGERYGYEVSVIKISGRVRYLAQKPKAA
jgi:hypothetical protein